MLQKTRDAVAQHVEAIIAMSGVASISVTQCPLSGAYTIEGSHHHGFDLYRGVVSESGDGSVYSSCEFDIDAELSQSYEFSDEPQNEVCPTCMGGGCESCVDYYD